jgi:hypothetical protein
LHIGAPQPETGCQRGGCVVLFAARRSPVFGEEWTTLRANSWHHANPPVFGHDARGPVGDGPGSLTTGKLNAVRAAFKAGLKPSAIDRRDGAIRRNRCGRGAPRPTARSSTPRPGRRSIGPRGRSQPHAGRRVDAHARRISNTVGRDAISLLITLNVDLSGSKIHLAHAPGLTRVDPRVARGSCDKTHILT